MALRLRLGGLRRGARLRPRRPGARVRRRPGLCHGALQPPRLSNRGARHEPGDPRLCAGAPGRRCAPRPGARRVRLRGRGALALSRRQLRRADLSQRTPSHARLPQRARRDAAHPQARGAGGVLRARPYARRRGRVEAGDGAVRRAGEERLPRRGLPTGARGGLRAHDPEALRLSRAGRARLPGVRPLPLSPLFLAADAPGPDRALLRRFPHPLRARRSGPAAADQRAPARAGGIEGEPQRRGRAGKCCARRPDHRARRGAEPGGARLAQRAASLRRSRGSGGRDLPSRWPYGGRGGARVRPARRGAAGDARDRGAVSSAVARGRRLSDEVRHALRAPRLVSTVRLDTREQGAERRRGLPDQRLPAARARRDRGGRPAGERAPGRRDRVARRAAQRRRHAVARRVDAGGRSRGPRARPAFVRRQRGHRSRARVSPPRRGAGRGDLDRETLPAAVARARLLSDRDGPGRRTDRMVPRVRIDARHPAADSCSPGRSPAPARGSCGRRSRSASSRPTPGPARRCGCARGCATPATRCG